MINNKNSKKSQPEIDEEVFELEFDEDSVDYYIEDENGNEIGVCLIEDGEQVEYFYEEKFGGLFEVPDDNEQTSSSEGRPCDCRVGYNSKNNDSSNKLKQYSQDVSDSLKQTKDELVDCKEDLGVVASELAKTASDLKESYQELMEDLNPIKKFKKNKKNNEANKVD